MYVIFNIIKVREEHLEKFLKGVYQHARNSSSEPGCVRYEVLQDVADPQTVCLYEVFRDEAAFKNHQTYDYYKEWMAKSKEWRHSENRIRHVLDYIYGPEDDLPSQ
jgi:(4S)-4-hydroxy-5-phosphonooxypentane-2,3-dione isomerase